MLQTYLTRFLLINLLWLAFIPAYAQLDTQHWMPPVWEPQANGPSNFGGQSQPTQLVISTPFSETEVTVTLTDGTVVSTGTAEPGSPLIVPLDTVQGMTYEAFTAEDDKGLIITSEQPVSVVYRNISNRNQALASLKGRFALGQDFRAGTQTRVSDEKYGFDDVHFISMMATEDNTTITIDAPAGKVLGNGENTITLTLNRNQTYLVRNSNADIGTVTDPGPYDPTPTSFTLAQGDNLLNNLAGTHVTSDKPITVMSGGQHLRFPEAPVTPPDDPIKPDADAGIDQIVPVTSGIYPMLGTDYIVVRGGTQRDEGEDSDLEDITDYAIIIGTEANTEITIDEIPIFTIGEGEIYEYTLPGGRDALGEPHHIRTSAPAYVYHFSGLSNHELGMSIVPSIDCAGSQYLSFNRFGSPDDENRIHIMAPAAAFEASDPLTINGQPYTDFDATSQDIDAVGWSTISFDYPATLPPNVIVQSSEYFHLAAVVGGPLPTASSVGAPGGTYAFLSNFARKVDVLDPDENFPTARYVADTVLQGDSVTHCLLLASCRDIYQIDSIQTTPNTGRAYPQAEPGEPNDTCLVYVPRTDYLGNDTVTVFVSNELGIPGKVDLIFHINGFPVAVADTVAISVDGVASGNVLTNDRNVEVGEVATLVPDQDVSNGTLVLNPDGTFTYTPNAGFQGEDQFTYQICDDLEPDSCSSAVVLILVGPFVEDVLKPGTEDQPVTFAIDDFAQAFTDGTRSLSTIRIESLPATGTLTLDGAPVTAGQAIPADAIANLTFTPALNSTDTVRFQWNGSSDGTIYALEPADVIIPIEPVVDGVFNAEDTTLTVDRNVAFTADLNGSVNDPEDLGYTFTTTPVTAPQQGTATLTDDGTLTYTSTGSFLGTDSLVYEVCINTDPPVCDQATATFIVVVPEGDETDTDGDGIPDGEEVGPDPANPQDSDGDGIPDYLDPLERDLLIYDGFAPGRGDDVWVIEGITNPQYINNNVKIYNRWGNLVYETDSYNNADRAWTGEANVSTILGVSEVPDGTYFYIINLGNNEPPRTGYVVLVR